MKPRFPLTVKILLWFFLNLILLVLVGFVLLRGQFRFGLDMLVSGPGGEKLQGLANVISAELGERPREEWNAILKRFGDGYGVQLVLARPDETIVAGELAELPRAVLDRLRERPSPNMPQQLNGSQRDNVRGPGGEPERFNERPRHEGFDPDNVRPRDAERLDPNRLGPPGQIPPRMDRQFNNPPPQPRPRFMVRTTNPVKYWAGIPLPQNGPQRPQPRLTLLAVSDSLRGGGLLFDYTPWLIAAAVVLIISVLFWLPLVRGITCAISQTTRATEEIAEGRFGVLVNERRSDELGVLAAAVNRMAARLSGFVSGQKRFLGDTAHELCAPIARMQIALGILEERAEEKHQSYVNDVREELQHISHLVNELLSFSKAGLRQQPTALQSVAMVEIARRVAERESRSGAVIEVSVDENLRAQAEPELLARALANLVRNSIRYAGESGPVRIVAGSEDGKTFLTVSDNGPGVPTDALQKIFDPFYRVEESRSRDTGGVGLGLAIVKTCVEACGGTVSARNREPNGLEVRILLQAS